MKKQCQARHSEFITVGTVAELTRELLDRVWAAEVAEVLESVMKGKNLHGFKGIPPYIRAELVHQGMVCATQLVLTEVGIKSPVCLQTDDAATTWLEALWEKGRRGAQAYVTNSYDRPGVKAIPPGIKVALIYRGMVAATDLLATAFQQGRLGFLATAQGQAGFTVRVERA